LFHIKTVDFQSGSFRRIKVRGSTGAESDETLHGVFLQQKASRRADARRAQLRA
jgi:hypothetical protein